MTLPRLLLALTSALLLALAPMPAQAPAGLDAALADLGAQLSADFAKDGVGSLSVGVVSGSRLVWSAHYGTADATSGARPTNDTDYRIGSITKQFTALMLLQLVETGTVRLTDPLEQYVPESRAVTGAPPGAPPVTLLQIATMMSGWSREPGGPMSDTSVGPVRDWEKKVLELLPRTTFANPPGTEYLYSNIGYATLGLALERAAKQPYTGYVAEHILRPLSMARSGFEPTPDIRKNLAHGFTRATRQAPPDGAAPDRELDGRGYRVPNGALFSTINDLAKFVSWELGIGPAGLIKKETQDANYLRVYSATDTRTALTMSSGYGLGFQATRRGDAVFLGHGGSTSGYHSSVLFHRPSRLGVVVLRSCDACAVDAGPVALQILDKLVKR
jgi:CubicO group peptidase (beta-lactamase class C family)